MEEWRNKIMKINTNSMKKVYEELFNTFCKKNHDYGSSFEQSLDKHGLVAGVVRMEDKMNRLSTLVDSDTDAQIASESLVDTLMDLSNYAAMSACWLMGQDEKTRVESLSNLSWKLSTVARNSTYGVGYEEPTESITTTIGKEVLEKIFHIPSFEGHQEKVNERAYYEKDGVNDEEIIKNWSLICDDVDITTFRSRATGQYLVEDDNPELFRKIREVVMAHRGYHNFVEDTNNKFESHIESLSKASWKPAPEDIVNKAELKGLENGYFIRQHINSDNSYRYTIAFNPEGTIKTQDGEEKPYLLECFGNDYDGMNIWAIHVFDTQEDMVAALNYDLTVRDKFKSKNFGDSIKGLDIETYVYTQPNAPHVFETWAETFGQAFDKQMTSKGLNIFELYQGIKTFGPVFISEKNGALIIKGNIRESSFKRSCDFIWFSDTKEVLLEKDDTTPKFNYNGVIYGVIYPYANAEYVDINPVYKDMSIKIMSKFNHWDASELKNLVFFNEDEGLE